MRDQSPRLRLLLICQDRMGASMAGPAIRYSRFAQHLARQHDVTLLLCQPADEGFLLEGVNVVECGAGNPFGPAVARQYADQADVVLTEPIQLPVIRELARSRARVVFDLYVPLYVEALGQQAGEQAPLRAREEVFTKYRLQANAALLAGDAFVCASSRQRDHWVGALAALGRLGVGNYETDPALAQLVGIVPFGIESEPARHTGSPALRGVEPTIDEDSIVLLWAGGIWNWFDPLTLLRAVHRVVERVPTLRLHFLGVQHPSPLFEEMRMTRRTLELAGELGLLGTSVSVHHGWVPYERRQDFLLESDIGVTAHFPTMETELSFRTRILDHFWAGLPSILTEGGAMSDLVAQRELGMVVPAENVGAWADAIGRMAVSRGLREEMGARTASVRASLEWPTLTARLEELLVSVSGSPSRRKPGLARSAARTELASFRVDRELGTTPSALKSAARRLIRRA